VPSLFGLTNIQLRLWLAVAMTVSAFVSVFGMQLAATHYSNSCDPGLERFKYLQSDPATQSKPAHAFIEWEWDQPDNEFLSVSTGCGWTMITYTMMGPDKHAIYQDVNQAFANNGWTQDPVIPGANIQGFERQSPYGKLEVIVAEDVAWVTATLNDLGGKATAP
jgi:hypothetical protein